MQSIPSRENWREHWQTELQSVLQRLASYRESRPYFFLLLLGFFFCVNALCYWAATVLAFPELLDSQPARIALIQQPVAVLGGLFDSLSFFITVYLIQRASVASSGWRFIAILSIDLLIAAVATAWVLLVVMLSSWLIGPAEPTARDMEAAISPASEISVNSTTRAEPYSQPQPVQTQPVTAAIDEPSEQQASDSRAARQETASPDNGFNRDFYRELVIDALSNPLANLRYFLFGVVMGLSTLLPTIFHLAMGIKTLTRKTST